ncbi:outer membrane protein/protective antigen OMA87 [Bernardetia litoralis DSM 6794]|uniref:Outer membrane protein/protective antigen OMA87 n=2 Tax=Bernardetia litoralis TaxID=999 RepID=I4AGD7_BERLS|nr:outer membrane protein/protective antigen OMA87 [Bernardetia litoralis DSM 6794]
MPNEKLLYNQKIEGTDKVDADELAVYYRQQPNRRILYLPITPYLYFYYLGKSNYSTQDSLNFITDKKELELKYDKKLAEYENATTQKEINKRSRIRNRYDKKIIKANDKIENGNWFMRSLGEKPTLFDTTLVQQTTEQMTLALHQKGYFANIVTPKISYNKSDTQKVVVTYQVYEGEPQIIRNINYQIQDTVIQKLIFEDSTKRLFNQKGRYNESKLAAERERITSHLRNNGYFDFTKQFVFFDVDSLIQGADYQSDITIAIENPLATAKQKNKKHKRFVIDSVKMIIDGNVFGVVQTKPKRSKYDSIKYLEYKQNYSKRVLNNKIQLRPNQYYSQENEVQTQRSLTQLNMYRFVNMRHDTTGGEFVTTIFANSHTKYNLSLEGGVGVNVSQIIPGPFFSISLLNRNTFGGGELLEFNGRGAIEYQAAIQGLNVSVDQTLRTQQFNFSTNLTIPQFAFPFPKKIQQQLGKYNARTQFQLGFSNTDRPEYTRTNAEFAMRYNWNKMPYKTYQIDAIDILLTNTTRINQAFLANLEELAANGNNLIFNFSRSLTTTIGGSYVYNDNLSDKKVAHYFKQFAEYGGTFLSLNNTNRLDSTQILSDTLTFSRFARIDTDFRYYKPIGKKNVFAYRARLGIAKPLGKESVLPYERYFFVGGGSSLRAWKPRRLGPGSYSPRLENGDYDVRFEQPGELLLELSFEWRRDLMKYIETAVFFDAGNVWMISEDKARPNSEFELNRFWKEIALNTGLGLRLDFSFLIIRADVGIRLYDPTLPLSERWVGNKLFRSPFKNSAVNIAIGYPF